ncbi:MAG TPA: helix-turn-helix domain-containing protein, partial [Paracoccaceae bacterium]|nr:helix-turn-helix domain-containing protein [Paracoccaceae bacterium]
ARRQVIETTRPLARIAVETGFSDPSAFAHAYARAHGEAPNATRRQARLRLAGRGGERQEPG